MCSGYSRVWCGGRHWLDHPRTVRPPHVHTQNTTSHTELGVRVHSGVGRVWGETDIGKHTVRGKLPKNSNHCVYKSVSVCLVVYNDTTTLPINLGINNFKDRLLSVYLVYVPSYADHMPWLQLWVHL
jgi:hypothetical protein